MNKVEPIEDASVLAQVRRQAKRVNVKAFFVALVFTLITLALPQ